MKHEWKADRSTNAALNRYVWKCSGCDQRVVSSYPSLKESLPEHQEIEDCDVHIIRTVMET